MWRYFVSITLILILGGASAGADNLQLSVSGLTTTYTPGSPLTFEVGLTGATNLNSYNVGLDLTSTTGTAGTDFYFAGRARHAAAAGRQRLHLRLGPGRLVAMRFPGHAGHVPGDEYGLS